MCLISNEKTESEQIVDESKTCCLERGEVVEPVLHEGYQCLVAEFCGAGHQPPYHLTTVPVWPRQRHPHHLLTVIYQFNFQFLLKHS